MVDGKASDLEGFRILSAQEFVVELDQPFSSFPAMLSHPAASVLPEGTERLTGNWREGTVGTGPFRVVQFDPRRRLELERNPLYWREGFPRSEGLVFRLGMTPGAILEEFRAGHLSIASDLAPKDVEALRHDAVLAAGYRETPRLSTYLAAFNLRRGPLADVALRRHLVAGLDVPGMVRRTLGRLAIPAHGIIPPGLLGYVADSAPPLAAGQPPVPADLELAVLVHPMFADQYSALTRELYQRLEEKGIRVRVLNSDMAGFFDGLRAGEGDITLGRWLADYPDTDTFVQILNSQAGLLAGYASVPEIDELMDQARVEIDPAVRHMVYRKVEELIRRDALVLPLFHEQVYRFARPEVEGLELSFSSPSVSYENLRIRR